MLRRRRRERKIAELARVLVFLDDAARDTRGWPLRRAQRVAVATFRP
jgi:hypothetical protein